MNKLLFSSVLYVKNCSTPLARRPLDWTSGQYLMHRHKKKIVTFKKCINCHKYKKIKTFCPTIIVFCKFWLLFRSPAHVLNPSPPKLHPYKYWVYNIVYYILYLQCPLSTTCSQLRCLNGWRQCMVISYISVCNSCASG